MKMDSQAYVALLAMAIMGLGVSTNKVISMENASIEFKRVEFPKGRPEKEESQAEMSGLLAADQEFLVDVVRILNEHPNLGLEIVGFADENECVAQECEELSLRRAGLVFDWLVRHGASLGQLKGPEGQSTNFPRDRSGSEDGRRLNRRVQFEPYLLKK